MVQIVNFLESVMNIPIIFLISGFNLRILFSTKSRCYRIRLLSLKPFCKVIILCFPYFFSVDYNSHFHYCILNIHIRQLYIYRLWDTEKFACNIGTVWLKKKKCDCYDYSLWVLSWRCFLGSWWSLYRQLLLLLKF